MFFNFVQVKDSYFSPFFVESCPDEITGISDHLYDINRGCVQPFTFSKEHKNSFGPEFLQNKTLSEDEPSDGAWIYSPPDDKGILDHGLLWKYHSGGFTTDLILNQQLATESVNQLREYLWLDKQTRVLYVEFIVYNAQVNVFSFVSLKAEFPLSGGAITSYTSVPVRVYAVGFSGIFTRVMEVLFVVFLLCNTASTIYLFIAEGTHPKWFLRARAILDTTIFVNGLLLIIFYALRYETTTSFIKDVKESVVHFIQFQKAALYHSIFIYCLASMATLAVIKFLVLLRLYERIAKLAASLKSSAKDLASVVLLIAVGYITFTTFGYLAFGREHLNFSTFDYSMDEMFSISLGILTEDGTGALVEKGSVLGRIYIIGFVFFAQIIMFNVLIVVILEANETFKYKPCLQPQDHRLVGVIFSQIKNTIQNQIKFYNKI